MTPRLHVLAIGGAHQFAHFLPVAFEIGRRASLRVSIFVPDEGDIPEIGNLAQGLGLPLPEIVTMDLPGWLRRWLPGKVDKIARLMAWAGPIRAASAILCAERTSTLLKWWPGKCPDLIHVPHGAGDRAVGFERRFSHFDKVIVSGPKDRERLLAEGVISEGRCAIGGPVKIAAVLRIQQRRRGLFENDRPVILYNPHFSRKLSSANAFTHRLVQAVMADGRYNLVVAPHIRLAQHWDEARRRQWEAMAVPDRIVVDLGSRRSIDMSYTMGADLYIGDVSSQVYEFLIRPRPCLFINAHGAAWEGNPDYAMWRFGEVASPDCDIPGAIERAIHRHPEFRPIQMQRTRAALHGLDWDENGEAVFPFDDPIGRAADIIEAHVMAQDGQARTTQAPAACDLHCLQPEIAAGNSGPVLAGKQ